MEIKDNDLKISDQFVNKQYLIDLEKNKLIKDFKKQSSDTIESNILLNKNIEYFKLRYKDTPYLQKQEALIAELRLTFPNLEVNKLSRVMLTNGFVSRKRIVFQLLLGLIILLIGLNFLVIPFFYLMLNLVLFLIQAIVGLIACVLILQYLDKNPL